MVCNAAILLKEVVFSKRDKTLVQILGTLINFKFNIIKVNKMSTGLLENIVTSNSMPDGIKGCGAFHNECAAYYRAKVGDLIQHSIQLSDLLSSPSLVNPRKGALAVFLPHVMPSTKNGANSTSLANVYGKF